MTAGVWVAPGRVNIIGEHTDYNDGYALPIALPQVVTCTATVTADATVSVTSRQHPGKPVRVPIAGLADAAVEGWARYPLGVVHEFVRRGHEVPGVVLDIDGAVPVGAGLSSSAALECSVALAIRDLFAPAVEVAELIDIGRAAENSYVGAATGTLDQSASLLCTEGHALFLDFATNEAAQVPFDLTAAGLRLLVADTDTPHRLADGDYGERRRECEAAAHELGVHSLRAITDPGETLRLADPVLRRRARHVITENARVLTVVDLLRDGRDPRAIGPLLTSGHHSLRDDFEVSTPELDAAADSALDAGAHGARMVGGGFGGSIIALTDIERTDSVAAAIRRRFRTEGFTAPRFFVATPSAGARRIGPPPI
ncbi:putative galactokinase GalK [Nocardia nova SH22a]|uniref:Galactokinase n=1 Tax=Nocardia nova SH22a TaxID=1415166 RepID=W5TBY1_9NOCA|nr:galactokinase [Nocardia nova]AHH16747.1 putative galactokinase GalK [Nocardia nova SH22a]